MDIPDFIKEDTRKRCKIFAYDDKTAAKFYPISAEIFHLLYDAKKIQFSIYVRAHHVVVEFIQPNELSKDLLDQVFSALQSQMDVEMLIQKSQKAAFDTFIDEIKSRKINLLLEKDPTLDRKMVDVFKNISNASQLVVRGGINGEVMQQVKQSASYLVSNIVDSESTIMTLSRMVIHDPTLYDHSASVAIISSVIATSCLPKPLGKKETEAVAQCGLYHDVGKTCVPGHILNKPGKFTPEEFEIMKSHAVLGEEELMRLVKSTDGFNEIYARVAGEHHERFSGSGYPKGRKGRAEDDPTNGIHLYTRIVSIADTYSALLMRRVYKPAYEAQDAIKIMAAVAKKDFDPEIFKAFLLTVVASLNKYQEQHFGKGKGRILSMGDDGNLQETRKLVI